jgi:hypothetical protein
MNKADDKRSGEDTTLRRALYNYEEGRIDEATFTRLCSSIEAANLLEFKDTLTDLRYIAPEVLESIVPDRHHPIHRLWNCTSCAGCNHYGICYPCSTCNREMCSACNQPSPDGNQDHEVCMECNEATDANKENQIPDGVS